MTTPVPPLPVVDPDSAAFWAGAAEGELRMARCGACGAWQHPPAELCRYCAGPLDVEAVSGRGSVFSFIVVRHASVPGHHVPYVVALVELEEHRDLRLTGVLQDGVDRVRIGAAVQAQLVPLGDSDLLGPEFVLVDDVPP